MTEPWMQLLPEHELSGGGHHDSDTCATCRLIRAVKAAIIAAHVPQPQVSEGTIEECCRVICPCCCCDGPPEDWVNKSTATPAGDDGGPRFVHVYPDGTQLECEAGKIREHFARHLAQQGSAAGVLPSQGGLPDTAQGCVAPAAAQSIGPTPAQPDDELKPLPPNLALAEIVEEE